MKKTGFRVNIRAKLGYFAVAVVIVFTIIVYGIVIPLVEQEKHKEREAILLSVVDSATSLIRYYEDCIRTKKWQTDPVLPQTREQAQKRVLQHLRQTRYGKDDHIFILDGSARMVMHPLKAELEGKSMKDVEAPDKSYPFRQMAFQSQRAGTVFIRYTWLSKWSMTVYEPQTTCAQYFYPWDWVVCSSLYTQDIDDAVREIKFRTTLYLGGGAVIGMGLLYLIGLLITRPIVMLADQVREVNNYKQNYIDQILTVQSNDEVGDLAEAFRQSFKTIQKTLNRLEREKENLRTILNSIGDAVIATDTDGNILGLNPVAEKLTGWDTENAVKKPLDDIFNIVHAKTRVPEQNPFHHVMATGRISEFIHHAILISRDGTEYEISTSAAPITTAEGETTGVVMAFRDTTKEHQKDRQLKESEEKYRQLVENANDAIFVAQDGKLIFSNSRTTEIFGYSHQELSTTPFLEFIHPDDRDMVTDRHLKRIRGEKDLPSTYLFKGLKKDGSVLTIQLSTVTVTWNNQPATLNFARDITELKRLEASLQQAQKMEAIGTLAGGIAHDFNNVLSGIFGYTQLTKMELQDPERASIHLEKITEAAERASKLVQQILTFSRQKEFQKQHLGLHTIVREAIELLRSSIPATIEIQEEIKSKSMIMGDPTRMHQVVMNLGTNAYHAMSEAGGIMTITMDEVNLSDPVKTSELNISMGKYVRLIISDTGKGMNEETLEKIFDPYFTTKEKEKGTGLGLALVHAIVEDHKGYIEVDSELEKGSQFVIYLPVKRTYSKKSSATDKEVQNVKHTGRIMLVDDEEDIRFTLSAILTKNGFKVVTYENGIQAINDFKDSPHDFDLIITDMAMPKMAGDELVKSILKIRHDIPVILCTGYSDRISKEDALDMGVSRFVHKPVTSQELLTLMSELLS